METKWHENIPTQGVLCKVKTSGSIVRITGESNLYEGELMDGIGKRHFEIDNLTPLTAAEWWKFAPWQDMKDAPRDGSEFTAYNKEKGMICTAYYDNEDNCFYTDWRGKGNAHAVYDFVWLPLPTVQS